MAKIDIDSVLQITEQIETMVSDLNISYIDACIEYCIANDFEPEIIGELIGSNQNIVSKIQLEAQQLNFIKKTSRLPV